MRTTVDIDDSLLQRLRHEALRRGVAFKHLLNRLLMDGLEGRPGISVDHYHLPTFSMGSPGIDVDKALSVAGELEDEQIARELEARK